MIDEHKEEQASLYVWACLTTEELRAFETAVSRSPELQQLVASLRSARDAVAGTAPLMKPSPQLKQKILAQIAPPQKVAARPVREGAFFTT